MFRFKLVAFKAKPYESIKNFKIDALIAENALTIPLHVPLGLALTEIIAETQIPTIAHHHDFYWENYVLRLMRILWIV